MKKLILTLIALLPTAANAIEYKTAFDRVIYDYCGTNRNWINDAGALTVAEEAAAGKIQLDVFMRIWDKTCAFDQSLNVAREVASGKISEKTFHSTLFSYCSSNRYYIPMNEAASIAREVKSNDMDFEAFEYSWLKTCNLERSRDVGRLAKKGKIDDVAYSQLLFRYCSTNRYYMDMESSIDVAQEVKREKIELATFKGVWEKTCNLSTAKEAGRKAAMFDRRAGNPETEDPNLEKRGSTSAE